MPPRKFTYEFSSLLDDTNINPMQKKHTTLVTMAFIALKVRAQRGWIG